MGYVEEPNEQELSIWNSGEQVKAIVAMRDRCGIGFQHANKKFQLYAMGETEKSLDPFELLKRIRNLENIKWEFK